MRTGALGLLLVVSAAASGWGQETPPAADPAASPDPVKHSGAPLGQFTIGALVVTPTLRVSELAFDSNVQYSAKRQADFLASGGPGLDLALPLGDHWKLDIQGGGQYYYFLRTKEQRRWGGSATGSLAWGTTGTRAQLSVTTGRDFSRPNLEVDARIVSDQTTYSATFSRDLGRLTATFGANANRRIIDEAQSYRGADLTTALTMDRLSLRPELKLKLTPITSLLFEGSLDLSRFPRDRSRDYEELLAGAGVMTRGIIKGQATAGFRQTQLSGGAQRVSRPYFRAGLSQALGRRVSLSERYIEESIVSAFATDGSLPTIERRSLALEMSIRFGTRIDLRLSGTREGLRSPGTVKVVLDNGAPASARRDDVTYIATTDLGITIQRARVGAFVSYTSRNSLYFADFGIQGLQAGVRVSYSPQ